MISIFKFIVECKLYVVISFLWMDFFKNILFIFVDFVVVFVIDKFWKIIK